MEHLPMCRGSHWAECGYLPHGRSARRVPTMTDHATQATSAESSSTPTRSDEPLNQRITSGEADLDEFREHLTLWLAGRDEVDSDAGVEVSAVSRPESSGMSNISVLFDAA